MPNTYQSTTGGDSITIPMPENVKRMIFTLQGAGGGGEYVNRVTGASIPGSSGGDTTFLGLTAGGGQGGGIGGKSQAGNGGVASSGSYDYSSSTLSSVRLTNGSRGQLNSGGTGAALNTSSFDSRDGGSGTTSEVQYTSSVTHYFNNDTDTNILVENSPDLTVTIGGQYSNDVPCGAYYFSKHYKVRFNYAYDNSSYNLSLYVSIPQTAAGGVFSGYASDIIKYDNGFDVWFCRFRVSGSGTVNSFVRQFTFTSSGNRSSLAGRGGGGGAEITGIIAREDLVSRGLLGRNYTLSIGSAGSVSNGEFTPYAYAGETGRGYVYLEYLARATITVDRNPIVRGESTTLRWTAYGDIESITVEPGINTSTGSNFNSSRTVNPTSTTTYFIRATGAIGGTAYQEVTLVVLQPPDVSLTGPSDVDYGSDVTLSYAATSVPTSLSIIPTYYYKDGTSAVGNSITLPVGDNVNGSTTTTPVYTTLGPSRIEYKLYGEGYGTPPMTDQQIIEVTVNIDETPDLIEIPETDDAFKNQDPVYSPKLDSLLTLEVNDVDIPVEIKSNVPLQVEIDNAGNYSDVREL